MSPLSLRAAVTRGALITAANWPVVLIDFVLESFYKLALTIPILGGALAVAAIVGTDVGAVVGEGVRAAADTVIGSLTTAPRAMLAFLSALALVAIGGEVIMHMLKAGTLAVLVEGERRAGDLHMAPIRGDSVSRAAAYRLEAVYAGVEHFGRRAAGLALCLGAADLTIGVAYLSVMGYGFTIVRWTWLPGWPLIVLVATTTAVVSVAVINLAYDLLRVIVVTDDCSIAAAFRKLTRFVTADSRQVIGIFAVMGGVILLATIGSLLAAAGLAVMAWMPFIGLVVVPLQAAAWILRGIAFQYMSLAALSAYQTQYRRFSDHREADPPG